jgi:putative acetyltransferase
MIIDDYDKVLDLWRKTPGVELNAADGKDEINFYLERNRNLSQVAEAGGEIIGAVLCGHDGRRGFIHHMAVSPDYRRQGIARKLADAALKGIKNAGIAKCHIFVLTDNEKAKIAWKSMGWKLRTDIVSFSYTIKKEEDNC